MNRVRENNPNWRGDRAGYIARHGRIYRQRGKATSCVWGCEHRYYEWANLTGRYHDTADYAQMCRRCHNRFDAAVRMMQQDPADDRPAWSPWRAITVGGSARGITGWTRKKEPRR